ncbi:hypothetical protein [Paenibacillus caui]|uniref:hypothetical protein n=1 Tax=Paenibacillus caui TaxID=2873927 RepID=UPI001CA982F1|nr:hypothetical protein [Paenibacillus caui]
MTNGKQKKRKGTRGSNKNDPSLLSKLTPQQIAVIAGILTNTLSVDSVLIGRDQRLEILLVGSLRRRTRIDELINELSNANLADVIDSILNR